MNVVYSKQLLKDSSTPAMSGDAPARPAMLPAMTGDSR
jgi:hypothetical protein